MQKPLRGGSKCPGFQVGGIEITKGLKAVCGRCRDFVLKLLLPRKHATLI